MQQLTTVYRKYVTQITNLSNPPLLKMWEIALPTPLRIDAPDRVTHCPSGLPIKHPPRFFVTRGFASSVALLGWHAAMRCQDRSQGWPPRAERLSSSA